MSDSDSVQTSEIKIPYRDINAEGRLHNASYLIHAEEALAAFCQGRPSVDGEPAYRLRKFACTLRHPLTLDDSVRFGVRVDKIGGKSVGFRVLLERDGEIAAEVEISWIAVDADSGDVLALPEETRDWLYRYLD